MKRKTAYLGLFAAVAIIFGYVESLVPVFTGIPGIKLGLANLAVLFILDRYSVKEAALVSVVRILVIGFMFGNLFSILYSLAGAALSLTVMELLKKHVAEQLAIIKAHEQRICEVCKQGEGVWLSDFWLKVWTAVQIVVYGIIALYLMVKSW